MIVKDGFLFTTGPEGRFFRVKNVSIDMTETWEAPEDTVILGFSSDPITGTMSFDAIDPDALRFLVSMAEEEPNE